jgi:hypothetical protein
MKRAIPSRPMRWRVVRCGLVLPFVCVLIAGATLLAQSREAYQQAYRDWRANDPNLERDTARAGDALLPRVDKAAAAASKFISARKAFYGAQRDDLAGKLETLQPLELPKEIESAKTAEAYLSSQEATVTTSIEVFGNDPDKGIQQLRQALERERQALIAVRGAIKTRESATDAIHQANEGTDRARNAAGDRMKEILSSFAQSDQESGKLADAWPAYYRALADAAHGLGGDAPTPAPAIVPSNPPSPVPPTAPANSGRGSISFPISRYTGSWTFLPGVSTYHGLAPVSFDVFVREEGGQIVGTVNATFVVASTADGKVRFDFSGPIQAGRNQTFPLKTAEGAQGTLELIPGNAFNLLEVNYTLEGAPGKVRESDVIVVKH